MSDLSNSAGAAPAIATITAAIDVVTKYKAAEPKEPLLAAIQELGSLFRFVKSNAASAGSLLTACRAASFALLQLASSTAAPPSEWENCVVPVVEGLLHNPNVPSALKCVVLKRLPAVLSPQSTWSGSEEVRSRVTCVVSKLAQQAVSLPMNADGSAELLEVSAALTQVCLIGGNTYGPNIVAQQLFRASGGTATEEQQLRVIQTLLAAKPPAALLVSLEECACSASSTNGNEDFGKRVLALLPKKFEGKGTFEIKAQVTALISALDNATDASASVSALLNLFEHNMASTKSALIDLGALPVVVKSIGNDFLPLPLVRDLTMIVVYANPSASDAAPLLSTAEAAIIGMFQDPEADPLDADIARLECRLLLLKKLAKCAGVATEKRSLPPPRNRRHANQKAEQGPRAEGDLQDIAADAPAADSELKKTASRLLECINAALIKLRGAEKTLSSQGNTTARKRQRDDNIAENATEQPTADDITLHELRAATSVVLNCKHILDFIVNDAGKDVVPSWLA